MTRSRSFHMPAGYPLFRRERSVKGLKIESPRRLDADPLAVRSTPPGRGIFAERAAWLAALLAIAHAAVAIAVAPGARAPILAVTLWHPIPRVLGLLGFVPLALGIVACRLRVGGPAAQGWAAAMRIARQEGWLTERLAGYVVLLLLLPPFFWGFAAWKTNLPPFTADAALAEWDRLIHGVDPYRLIAALQRPWLTKGLDDVYYAWRYLLVGLVLWQGWLGTPRARARFWLAFVLTWIMLGTVLAHLVPSAGPAYYQRVTGSWGPFAPLMTYLRAASETRQLDVLGVQAALWAAVERGEVVFGGGISAFPSLHVAMPVLGACAAWSTHRWLAWTFVAFGVLIFLGSIHLGWHYALDGEAAVAGVVAIWWTTGPVGRVGPESDLPQGNASATPR